MLETIDGPVRAPREVQRFEDPTIEFSNQGVCETRADEADRVWLEARLQLDIHNNPDLDRDLPSFVRTLDRFAHHGTRENIETISQRLMMLAYYLGLSLGYDYEQIRARINDAKWERKA